MWTLLHSGVLLEPHDLFHEGGAVFVVNGEGGDGCLF